MAKHGNAYENLEEETKYIKELKKIYDRKT